MAKKYKIKNKTLYKSIARHKQILEQTQSVKLLNGSEEKFRYFVEQSIDGIILINQKGEITEWNYGMELITKVNRENVIGCNAWDIICKFINNKKDNQVQQHHKKIILESFDESSFMFGKLFEHVLIAADGTNRVVQELSFPIRTNTEQFIGCIIRDITQQKKMEKKIRYLATHDTLTGIHNRTYFEEYIKKLKMEDRLPFALIVCDMDNLKLINDALGHKAGDEILLTITNIIKKCLRKDDIIARIGGDEFVILLPYGSITSTENICHRIKKNVEKYNQLKPGIPLSISMGFAIKDNNSTSIDEIFKKADYNMYQQKLLNTQSNRNILCKSLIKVLEEKNHTTKEHTSRLQTFIAAIATSIGLSDRKQQELKLFGKFYDIGKTGISDDILLKSVSLTSEEKAEIMKHSEIGYRIALSTQDLSPIANWILCHHEWWNGNGYPLGIKGAQIPLECRILAIADAYDAMTSDRPYRKAISHEEAVTELKKCAGTQFDPELVDKFIDILEAMNDK